MINYRINAYIFLAATVLLLVFDFKRLIVFHPFLNHYKIWRKTPMQTFCRDKTRGEGKGTRYSTAVVIQYKLAGTNRCLK